MPYSITTKDGITIQGIPDNVRPDDPSLVSRVRNIRAQNYKPTAEERAALDPTKDMSGIDKFRAGVGKAFSDIGFGARQLFSFGSDRDEMAREADERKKADAPLMNTGAGIAGNVVGAVAPLAATALIPGANTVTGGAALGALTGLLQPTGTQDSAAGQVAKDAALGGVGNAAARALPIALKALTDPFRQGGRETIAGRTLNTFAGDSPAVIAAARAATAATPGYVPTLTEATQNAGIGSLDLALRSNPQVKRDMAEHAGRNTQALADALRGVAGTPAERRSAEAMRDYMATGYRHAAEEGIDPARAAAAAPLMNNLLERMPAGVLERARELARISGQTMGTEGSVQGLQWVKAAVDDMISGAADTAVGTQMRRALTQFKGDLMATAEQLSPTFARANADYATFSRPINEQQVGQYLLDRFLPAITDHATGFPTRSRAQAYAESLRNAPQTIQRSTGMRGFDELSDVMSPGGVRTVEGVAQDLSRRAAAEDLMKTTGSTTAQNLSSQNLIRQVLGPMGMPQSWSERIASSSVMDPVRRATGMIYSGGEQRLNAILAEALRNPQRAAQLMERATAPTIENARLADALRAIQQGGAFTPLALVESQQ